MCKLISLVFLTSLLGSNNVFAQDKFEKESRVNPKDVPSKALLFIGFLNLNKRVKWYQEEGLSQKSIEAKFNLNKVKYSVEFDTLGQIEDIEIEVNWDGLQSSFRDSVSYIFKQNCTNHKVVKVQKQFTGSESDLQSVIVAMSISKKLKVKYEIVVRCSRKKKVDLFEYLFNEKGTLIATSKIVFRNSSHLEY